MGEKGREFGGCGGESWGTIIWDSSIVGEEEGREREGVWGVRRDLGTKK